MPVPPDLATLVPPPGPATRRGRRSATRRIFLRLCGAAVSIGVAAPVEARYIEPFAVETTRHDAYLPDLPLELDGMTIAHLTDLHRGPVTPDPVIRQAIAITRAAKPDLIALTGDFVAAHPDDAVKLAEMMKDLTAPLGLWGCLGNHDYGVDATAVATALEHKAGVHMLRNRAERVAPGLWLSGIEDTLLGHPDAHAATAKIPEKTAAVFLTHNPVGIFKVSQHPWLALAGHTHGGQILIPGLPTPMPPGMDGFPLAAGWGIFDQAQLYISRGVGMVMAPFRFRCRPEVAIITLHRGTGTPKQRPNLAGRAARKAIRVARNAWHHLT